MENSYTKVKYTQDANLDLSYSLPTFWSFAPVKGVRFLKFKRKIFQNVYYTKENPTLHRKSGGLWCWGLRSGETCSMSWVWQRCEAHLTRVWRFCVGNPTLNFWVLGLGGGHWLVSNPILHPISSNLMFHSPYPLCLFWYERMPFFCFFLFLFFPSNFYFHLTCWSSLVVPKMFPFLSSTA